MQSIEEIEDDCEKYLYVIKIWHERHLCAKGIGIFESLVLVANWVEERSKNRISGLMAENERLKRELQIMSSPPTPNKE